MERVKLIVFSNLDEAKNNAHEIFGWKPEDIAIDMIDLASDCQEFEVNQIVPYIKEYLEVNNEQNNN